MLWIPLNYQWKMPDILLVMKIPLDCAAAEFFVNVSIYSKFEGETGKK
jgi:hypothetical protein